MHGGGPAQIIHVPDIPSRSFIETARDTIGLTYIDHDFVGPDFMGDGRGRKFEALHWRPERDIQTQEVRAHFHELGCVGNAAAFVAWVMRFRPIGWHVTIIDDGICSMKTNGRPYVPYFYRLDPDRELNIGMLRTEWTKRWSYVGFRQLD